MYKKDYWVTNISKMNVSLADLNLTIKAMSSVNLLDKKHYSYTYEQLELSRTQGSMAKKKDKIVPREIPPEIKKKSGPIFIKDAMIPPREKSTFDVKQIQYEELNLTDEQFADENAETAELDRQPLIVKDSPNVTSKTLK